MDGGLGTYCRLRFSVCRLRDIVGGVCGKERYAFAAKSRSLYVGILESIEAKSQDRNSEYRFPPENLGEGAVKVPGILCKNVVKGNQHSRNIHKDCKLLNITLARFTSRL